MESSKCEVQGCAGKVDVAIMRPVAHNQVEDRFYCSPHGAEAIDEIAREFARQRHVMEISVDNCVVDIELVVCDGRDGRPSQVFLHERDGQRRLAFRTGRFEAWLLGWELKRKPAPPLSTHRATATALRALGADLMKVIISDVSENETYRTHLQMSQAGSLVVVDMRPSDALTLAVVCNIPVYVESLVWQKILR